MPVPTLRHWAARFRLGSATGMLTAAAVAVFKPSQGVRVLYLLSRCAPPCRVPQTTSPLRPRTPRAVRLLERWRAALKRGRDMGSEMGNPRLLRPHRLRVL